VETVSNSGVEAVLHVEAVAHVVWLHRLPRLLGVFGVMAFHTFVWVFPAAACRIGFG
jgi:hypothetical protein